MAKLGLVLSGGGGLGAYQIGVIKALRELGIEKIDAISGASIGALNGAIIASSPNLYEAECRLAEIWKRLPELEPLSFSKQFNFSFNQPTKNILSYLSLLVSVGLPINSKLIAMLKPILGVFGSSGVFNDVSVLSDKPLKQMMDEYLDIEHLQNSMPLYVSVYRLDQADIFGTFLDIAKAVILNIDTPPSSFEHIQSLPKEQQREMLLASAALPLLFKSKRDDKGNVLIDGGIGGWLKNQGNTPVTPLVEAGCDQIIVTHLTNGSLFNKYDFPQANCLEIRPNPKLDMSFGGIIDFSETKIQALQQFGYEDTLNQLGNIISFENKVKDKRRKINELNQSIDLSEKSNDKMSDILSRL